MVLAVFRTDFVRLLTSALGVLAGACLFAAEERTGEQIYRTVCLSCHGPGGEGTAEHKKPLIGDLSILELARVIDKTMPEGEPEKVSADEARRVAEYIYHEFYSPTAQERIRPARIELARLTNRQYQNAVADLIAALRGGGAPQWGGEQGLRGQYFKSRRMDRRSVGVERIDPTVEFDFGVGGPDASFEPHEFSIKWSGSLLAPDTGEYEFLIRTEHAARLWINDDEQPLIDAWVKSGNDTEYRAPLRLLGGRIYNVRLEYTKAKQGVQDQKKNKPIPAVKSSITLLWKPPRKSVEVIPARCLSPNEAPPVFVVGTPFPPDDRSVGYERGTSVSKAWDQATTDAAIEGADYISRKRERLAGTNDQAADHEAKYQALGYRLVERAFRRPLTDEQKSLYVDRHFAAGVPPEAALKRVALAALKSPRFLFREPGAGGDAYDVASRLSFAIWDSLPDEPLLKAAANGQLASREQVLSEAQRMLADLRARAKLRAFFQQWLRLDQIVEVTKDPQQFPEFTPEVASDLRTSLELFVDDVVFSDASDYRRLFTADTLPLNDRLLAFFDVDQPADALLRNADFRPTALDAEHRAGVVTHPYLMASFAYHNATSPIHRGVWIWRSLFGRALKVPPEAVAPLVPELAPDLTTRERVTLQTKAEACMSCHTAINPLGFTLEEFDALGRFRTHEKGKPIDDSGRYITREGQEVEFRGARDLAAYLAGSPESHAAFVGQLFHYVVKQPIRAYGADQLPKLQATFAARRYNIRDLVAEIATAAALPPATAQTAGVGERPSTSATNASR